MQTFVFLVAALFFVNSRNPGSGEVEAPHAALAGYLETAALTWMKLPECSVDRAACAQFERQEHESPAAVADRINGVAWAVANVMTYGAWGHEEPALYPGDPDHARTGLLLMSLAFHESRFRGYVFDGRCSDPAWRAGYEAIELRGLGTCDGGQASSIWQLHMGRGFVVSWGDEHMLVRRDDVIGPGVFGPVVALHMARASLAAAGTLRYYTGEGIGRAPAARAREVTADAYYHAHPFAGIVGP